MTGYQADYSKTPCVSSLFIFEVGNSSRVAGTATVPVSDWSRRISVCFCQRPIKLFNTAEANGGYRDSVMRRTITSTTGNTYQIFPNKQKAKIVFVCEILTKNTLALSFS